MNEYIYILSNPSMPGLIKVGKTTTHPSQRMAELHSTGVPTPFVLEFSAKVGNSQLSERAAHTALAKFRVAGNREFFRVTVRKAIETMLPHIGLYEIHDVRETHGIAQIQEAVSQKERARIAAEEARQSAEKWAAQAREAERQAKRRAIEQKIRAEESRIAQLGPRPVKKELSGLATFVSFCYFPIPIGWLVWFGTLNVFDPKRDAVGWTCVVLLIAGYFAWEKSKRYDAVFDSANRPFAEIDSNIYDLKEEMRKLP